MERSTPAFVAGGTGTAGRAYVRALLAAGYDVTATARDESGSQALAELGATPAALDLTDAEATAGAISESSVVIAAVLGRGPQPAAQEESITRNVIDAAARSGASRLVYTSVRDADRPTGVPHFEVKGRLERRLATADVPATVVRPCTFMEALSAPWIRDGVLSRGVLTSPIAVDTPISYIAASDVAEVGVRSLADPELAGKTIELGGPRAVTYRDLLPVLSRLLGRKISYEGVPLDVVESQFGADLAAMVRLFNREGFAGEADPVVERLGVSLTSIEDFLEAEFVPTGAVVEEG